LGWLLWLGPFLLAELCDLLARFHRTFGRLPEAEAFLRQGAELRRRAQGEGHPEFLAVVNQVATVQLGQGKYAQAEALYGRLIDMAGRAGEPGRADLVRGQLNLGFLYVMLGRFEEGERLYRQARAAAAPMGQDHEHFLVALQMLGELYLRRGDTQAAAPLLRKVAAIRDDALGMKGASRRGPFSRLVRTASGLLAEGHVARAGSLRAMAWLDRLEGRPDAASRRLSEALAILRRTRGGGEMAYSQVLSELGQLRFQSGQYAEAETAFREALNLDPFGLGEHRPGHASQVRDLALSVAGCGRLVESRDLMARVIRLQEGQLDEVFTLASEEKQLLHLGSLSVDLDIYLSLVLASRTPDINRDAFEVVFRRKGLAAEVLAARRDAILSDRHPQLRSRLNELALLRGRLAELILAGPGAAGPLAHREQLLKLRRSKDALEQSLAREVPEAAPALALGRATRHEAAQQLNLFAPRSALVEFIRVRILHAERGQPLDWSTGQRYLAFVLPAGQPDSVQLLDLGAADLIDAWVQGFRRNVLARLSPHRGGSRVDEENTTPSNAAGEQLRLALVEPLLAALPGCTRWLFAPDGELYSLPFEALPDSGGHLLDRLEISYVAVGREVLRFGAATKRVGPAAVVAGPDFDLADHPNGPVPGPDGERFARPQDEFDPLPWTNIEGTEVARALGVSAWQGKAALKRSVQGLRSPRVLHLATHGFVLPAPAGPTSGTYQVSLLGGRASDNPLLRAALALAGVNAWLRGHSTPPEAGNGLLTAEEVTSMDLTGTRLVVLSACETGLGDVTPGEGVFGLRRAFALAGAISQVMSLWQVPDRSTADLMVAFYAGLSHGLLPQESLRQAQRQIRLRDPQPHAWAGFIFQGDPSAEVF
jgi:CHAT domain-containing protein/tetratricopeptide (TPR) repeat protein